MKPPVSSESSAGVSLTVPAVLSTPFIPRTGGRIQCACLWGRNLADGVPLMPETLDDDDQDDG